MARGRRGGLDLLLWLDDGVGCGQVDDEPQFGADHHRERTRHLRAARHAHKCARMHVPKRTQMNADEHACAHTYATTVIRMRGCEHTHGRVRWRERPYLPGSQIVGAERLRAIA